MPAAHRSSWEMSDDIGSWYVAHRRRRDAERFGDLVNSSGL